MEDDFTTQTYATAWWMYPVTIAVWVVNVATAYSGNTSNIVTNLCTAMSTMINGGLIETYLSKALNKHGNYAWFLDALYLAELMATKTVTESY